jgi:hypothetical protein
MALLEEQAQLVGTFRNLLMGAGTPYDLQSDFNPFTTSIRADQGGERPYNHGSWLGAEWMNSRVVPIRVIANGAAGDVPTTRAAINTMSAAFSAVGATGELAELRFRLKDDDEFVLFGTPRGIDPDMDTLDLGYSKISTAFVAADPRIYSGTLTTQTVGLPLQQGGLTVDAYLTGGVWRHGLVLPTVLSGRLAGGTVTFTNTGTVAAPLLLRIDGPAVEPWVRVRRPDGIVQSIHFNLTLAAGQWLTLDSTSRQALLNDDPASNQRGRAVWDLDAFPLLPGATVVRFGAAEYNADALLTVSARSAWL